MSSEVKWSCGCYEMDGKVVQECTQTAPQGNVSAEQHAVNKPFARRCARLANAPVKPEEPPVLTDEPAN